jgi:membrane-bound lytic murein transglycosylase D
LILVFLILFNTAFSENLFPVDEYMKTRVDFWKKVYTEISTTEGFLHDENDLSIIYEKISIEGILDKARIKKIKEKKKRWSEVILSVFKNENLAYSPEEQSIKKKIENFPKNKLIEMARGIRFQTGLSDRYFQGLEESYKYLEEIRVEFKQLGLPEELAYLPHVESSFNYRAYSKVGAVGIWQFMWGTARLYKLKRNYLIDERRDPLISTLAAAKLLRDNNKRFNSWPLAITAYNSGPNNVTRAIIKTKSKDLSEILKKYDRGRFGFASKNFYATFLAVLEISENPKKYFKTIQKREHPPFDTYILPQNTRISHLSKIFKLDLAEIENHNLALRPEVFKRDLFLPKGFSLKIPKDVLDFVKLVKISEEKPIREPVNRTIASKDVLKSVKSVKISEERPIKKPVKRTIASNVLKDVKLVKISKEKEPVKRTIVSNEVLEDVKLIKNPEESPFTEIVKTIIGNNDILEDFKLVKIPEEKQTISSVDIELYRIKVEPDETLGHFVDWSLIPKEKLLELNKPLKMNVGAVIILPISGKSLDRFLSKRAKYHDSIQKSFFDKYKIDGVSQYEVKKGDTLEKLTGKLDMPLWLIKKYQKKEIIREGETLEIPKIVQVSEKSPPGPSQ